MFGIDLLDHDERYVYLAEILGLLKRWWTATDEFDCDSRYFRMKGALSRPQPRQMPTIPIMNAGPSPSGQAFAAQHSDIGLIQLLRPNPLAWAKQVRDYKTMAREQFGRELKVFTNVIVNLGDTDAEAETYVKRYTEEFVDSASVDSFLATLSKENGIEPGSERHGFLRRAIAIGLGAPATGSPATVANMLVALSHAGIDGVILTFVDFLRGLERFQRDVMPLLKAAGARHKIAG